MNNQKIQEKATYFLACEKEGFTLEEKENFDLWIKEETLHEEVYKKAKQTQEMFKNLSSTTSSSLSKKAKKGAKRTKFIEEIKPLASAAMILLVLSFGLFKYYDSTKPLFSHTYMTDTKKIHDEVLPDGSIISLDVKSEVAINLYKKTREVELIKGKAMFNVAKNTKQVFLIKSGNTLIEVVGTRFEVYRKNKLTKVKVEEGKVRVSHITSSGKNKNTILLKQADTVTFSDLGDIGDYSKIDPLKVALWRKDLIILNQVSLENAIKEFSRYKNFELNFLSQEVKEYIITGEFSSKQFDIFLNSISKIYPIKVHKKGNLIQISKIN